MLMTKDSVPYKMAFEGELQEYKTAQIKGRNDLEPEYDFLKQFLSVNESQVKHVPGAKIDAEHLHFIQRDACNLPQSLGQYHVAFAANLIDRLPDPEKFLNDIGKFIVPGGFLVMLSPYTWLEEYTPKDKWLGGKTVNAEQVLTLHTVEEILSPWFEPFHIVNEGEGYDDPLYGKFNQGESRQAVSIPFLLRDTRRRFQFTYSELSIWRRKME